MSFDSLGYSEEQKKLMERSSGRKIESLMDYEIASMLATPSDYSLFDYKKNIGLNLLLGNKYIGRSVKYKQIEIVDSDSLKCILYEMESGTAHASFIHPNDPENIFNIFFDGFTLKEVEAMIATITFDSEAKR